MGLVRLLEGVELQQAKLMALELQQRLIDEADGLIDLKLSPRDAASLHLIASCEATGRFMHVRLVGHDKGAVASVKGNYGPVLEFDLPAHFTGVLHGLVPCICNEIAFVAKKPTDREHIALQTYLHTLLQKKAILVKAGGKYYRLKHKVLAKNLKQGVYVALPTDKNRKLANVLKLKKFNSSGLESYASMKELLASRKLDDPKELFAGAAVIAVNMLTNAEVACGLSSGDFWLKGDRLRFYETEEVKP